MLNFNNKIYNFFKNKNSDLFLYLISFLESIFFPIPTDAFLIPKALINKDRAIRLGIFTTIFSVLGGIVGYSIGYFFYDEIGIRIIDEFNLTDQFNNQLFRQELKYLRCIFLVFIQSHNCSKSFYRLDPVIPKSINIIYNNFFHGLS
jgi:membrane protein YqaA with SNARE-associated domain